GGTLSAANETIGRDGAGTLTQSGTSTNTIGGQLTIAQNAGSTGAYNLRGGTLNAGTITVNTGGVFGFDGGSANFGSFNLNGGAVTASADEVLDTAGQSNSNYTLTHAAGSNTVAGTLVVGAAAGNTGIYQLQGGTLSAANETIGRDGAGTLAQSGTTTNTVSGQLTIAQNAGSTGAYNLRGGTLNAGTIAVN